MQAGVTRVLSTGIILAGQLKPKQGTGWGSKVQPRQAQAGVFLGALCKEYLGRVARAKAGMSREVQQCSALRGAFASHLDPK